MTFPVYHALACLGTSAIVAGVLLLILWRPILRPSLIRWALGQLKTSPRLAKRNSSNG